MLPDFPELKKELRKMVTERLRRGVYRETTLLSRMRKFDSHEGNSFSVHRGDGTVDRSTYRAAEATMTIDKKDLATLSPKALTEKIDQAALEMAEQTSKTISDKLHQVTSDSGQVHDAKGKPLSPDTLLEALEKIDIDFNKDGEPSGLTVVVGPELAEHIRRKSPEWEADPEFKRRHRELMDRKREAWRDRESRRTLAD